MSNETNTVEFILFSTYFLIPANLMDWIKALENARYLLYFGYSSSFPEAQVSRS